MTNSKLLSFSILTSLVVHYIFIFSLSMKSKNEEIYVVNLSNFQEFNSPPVTPQKVLPIPLTKQEKKITTENKKPIEKKEKIKQILKKENIKKDEVSIKKPDKIEKIEKELKSSEDLKKTITIDKKITNEKLIKNVPKKFSFPSKSNKNSIEIKNNKVIVNKMLSDYLTLISLEINKIASRSYPTQSIKRREQGTIVSVLVMDQSGNLLNIEIKNKSPQRLHKATRKILKSFKFPKPPSEILDSRGRLKIKIPVNFILR